MAPMSHTSLPPSETSETRMSDKGETFIPVVPAMLIVAVVIVVAIGFYWLVRLVDPVYYGVGIALVVAAAVFYKLVPAPIIIKLILRDKNSNRR
jgi:fatty acid desaturase